MKKSLINLMSVLIALAMVLTSTAVFVSAAGEEDNQTLTVSSTKPLETSYATDWTVAPNYPENTAGAGSTQEISGATYGRGARTLTFTVPTGEAGRYKVILDSYGTERSYGLCYSLLGVDYTKFADYTETQNQAVTADTTTNFQKAEFFVYLHEGEHTITIAPHVNYAVTWLNPASIAIKNVKIESAPCILSSDVPTTFSYADFPLAIDPDTGKPVNSAENPSTTGKPAVGGYNGKTDVRFYLYQRTATVVAPEAGKYKLSFDIFRSAYQARVCLIVNGQNLGAVTPETGTDDATFMETETYVNLNEGENTLEFTRADIKGDPLYSQGNNIGMTTVTFDYLDKDTVVFSQPTVTAAKSNGGVRAYVNASDEDNTVLILAAYGNDNTLLSVKYEKANLATDGAVITIGDDKDLSKDANIETIRAFLWTDGTLAPINNGASIN